MLLTNLIATMRESSPIGILLQITHGYRRGKYVDTCVGE